MVKRRDRNLRAYQALRLLFVGLWLFGQVIVGCSPATRPTAPTQPFQGVAAKEPKLPTTLAEIVTFSVQGDQVVAGIHWKLPGKSAKLQLLDMPGETLATNMHADHDPTAAIHMDYLRLSNMQQDGNEEVILDIDMAPDGVAIHYGHGIDLGKIGHETSEHVLLQFKPNGSRFDRWHFTQGQYRNDKGTAFESWADLRDLHPDEFRRYVCPLLQKLHIESLVSPDLWEYQVLSDRIDPWPLYIDATAKKFIQQLADPSPEKRDEASDLLKDMGHWGLAALARLDRSKLSAEQIKELEKVAHGRFLDDQQVKALKTDKGFLLDCLRSTDEDVRIAAAAQLTALLGREIPYDADDPVFVRGQDISNLRHQLFPTTWPTGRLADR